MNTMTWRVPVLALAAVCWGTTLTPKKRKVAPVPG